MAAARIMAPLPLKKKLRAAPPATLSDDVLLEILSRVADDIPTLFRCAVACKPWRALVADPSFLLRCWTEGARHLSSFLGLFRGPRSSDGLWISGPPTFVPSTRPLLSPPASIIGILDNAVPLASRHGLLLVQLLGQTDTGLQLAVCDMFAHCSVVHSNVVACRGKVHRLVCHLSGICNLYTFDLSNDKTSLTKLSLPLDQLGVTYEKPPWLSVTIDGKLSLVSLHNTFLQLQIWTHQGEEDSDESAADWLCTKVIQLKLMMRHIKKVSCMCVSDRTRTLLIMDQLEFQCIVNLETGAVDDIMTQFFSMKGYNVLPFEMDWPVFFMSRLKKRKK
ncbi:hypothetical protein VPH35_120544 [Triticum aestivum]